MRGAIGGLLRKPKQGIIPLSSAYSTSSGDGSGRGRGRGGPVPSQFQFTASHPEKPESGVPAQSAAPVPGRGHGRGKPLPSSPFPPSFNAFVAPDRVPSPEKSASGVGRGRGGAGVEASKEESRFKTPVFFSKDGGESGGSDAAAAPVRGPVNPNLRRPIGEANLPDNLVGVLSGMGRGQTPKGPEMPSQPEEEENRHLRPRRGGFQPGSERPRDEASMAAESGDVRGARQPALSRESSGRRDGFESSGRREGFETGGRRGGFESGVGRGGFDGRREGFETGGRREGLESSGRREGFETGGRRGGFESGGRRGGFDGRRQDLESSGRREGVERGVRREGERGEDDGRGRGRGRRGGRGSGRNREEYGRDDEWRRERMEADSEENEEDDIFIGDDADGEKFARQVGPNVMNMLTEAFEEVSSEILPSVAEDEYLDALDTNLKFELEPEYHMADFETNPDIDEKPQIPLRDALEKMKPFLMVYEGIKSEEEWKEVVEETMARVPLLKEIVDHYAGPDTVTAKQQQGELERVAKTLPASAPDSVKRFTERAVLSLQSNPGWGFDKKWQFMDRLVAGVSQVYK